VGNTPLYRRARLRRSRIATLLAMVGTLLMSSGLVLTTTATSAQAVSDKVFVCKYVGKPGVDERLKEGRQPISVSASSTDAGWFADGHDYSFVVGPDNTGPGPDDDPPASVCPSVEKPQDRVVTTTETGEKDCATGARERTKTVTTGYVLSSDGHTWVLGDPGEPVYSDWTTRPLTAQERADLDCDEVLEPTPVRPVLYGSTDATCEVAGSLVVKGQPAGVTATQSPAGTGPGTYTITFTAAKDFVLDGPATQTVTVPAKRTGEECDEKVDPTPVTPVPYATTDPTCEAAGSLVVKDQPTGVTATQSPAGSGPGTYTITFTAAEDFVLDGPATQAVTVLPKLTGENCDDGGDGGVNTPQPAVPQPQPAVQQPPVTAPPPATVKGVKESKTPKAAKPKPAVAPGAAPNAAPAPAVLGVQSSPAVPTAVSAGLGSLPATGPVSADLLGRLLAAAGLTLLLAAGGLGLGRRTSRFAGA
jgi:hypothetical protein